MGCFIIIIASLALSTIAFTGNVWLGVCGGIAMFVGLYRLILAIKSRSRADGALSTLMAATGAFGAAVHLVAGPTILRYFVANIFMGLLLVEVVTGNRTLASIVVTLVIWGAGLPPCAKILLRMSATRQVSVGVVKASGRIRTLISSVYRIHAVPTSLAASTGTADVSDDLNRICAMLAFHGMAVATPFVASRLTSLLFGTISIAAVKTDPSVIVGLPILMASFGLLLLCSTSQAKTSMLPRLIVGALITVVCSGVLWAVAMGRVVLTWTLVNPDSTRSEDRAITLSDFVGRALFRSFRSGNGPFFSKVPSWPAALAALLYVQAALLFVVTLAVLFFRLRARRALQED